VARRQQIGSDLVNVVSTWLARSYHRLDLIDGVHVYDRLLSVAADSEHRRPPEW
jgi:hypothetical protein